MMRGASLIPCIHGMIRPSSAMCSPIATMRTRWPGPWRTASPTALVMACSGRTIAAPAHKSLLSFSEPIRASKNPSGRESLLRLPAFLCISWSMIAINYEHISMRTFLNPQYSALPIEVKPLFPVTTTLFAPLAQWMTMILPPLSKPQTMPTWLSPG